MAGGQVGPAPERRLQFVADADWKSPYMMSWRDEDITTVLDEALATMQATAAHLRCPPPLSPLHPPVFKCPYYLHAL